MTSLSTLAYHVGYLAAGRCSLVGELPPLTDMAILNPPKPTETVARLAFWGVRGSTPTVERGNWRYGGNTPCLEFTAPDGSRIILDCGIGLRGLGKRWTESLGDSPVEAHIFVTHYHWDHIQGIPFFAPLYPPQNRFHFYSFRSSYLGRDSLKQVFETQMARPYFPVNLSVMAAEREYSEISGGDTLEINGTRIIARWLNHPQGCLGFRFETSAGIVVYATDNEPGDPELDRSLRELAAGADIFINDAQYLPDQLTSSRKGWGHSTWLEGVRIAREVGARNLVLFHHDPESSDCHVDTLLRDARDQFPSVWAAAEGMVMQLGNGRVEVAMRGERTSARREAFFRAQIAGQTEAGGAFEEKTVVRNLALHGAYLYLTHVPRLQSEVRVILETPGDGNHGPHCMTLRGYVVRREPGPEDLTGVGIVFAEELDTDLSDND